MTTVLAISTDQTLWWVTLGIGLVVALVVTALLEMLRRTVVQVQRGVEDVWAAGQRVAQNTQTSHLLSTTKERGGDLVAALDGGSGRGANPAERSQP